MALAGATCITSASTAPVQDALERSRRVIAGTLAEPMRTLAVHGRTTREVVPGQPRSGALELYLELPDKYLRVDAITVPRPLLRRMGFNGAVSLDASGGSSAPSQTTQPTQANPALVRNHQIDISRYLLGWTGRVHPALKCESTPTSPSESAQHQGHVINVSCSDFKASLLIDNTTHLPSRVSYQQDGQPTAQYSLRFDDWKSVDGAQFPHSVQRFRDNTKIEDWVIEKVEINRTIETSIFTKR